MKNELKRKSWVKKDITCEILETLAFPHTIRNLLSTKER